MPMHSRLDDRGDLGFDKSGEFIWKCTLGLALKSYSLQFDILPEQNKRNLQCCNCETLIYSIENPEHT